MLEPISNRNQAKKILSPNCQLSTSWQLTIQLFGKKLSPNDKIDKTMLEPISNRNQAKKF